DVLHEVEALAVEQHVLLLDSERVGLALTECMVEDAAARREALAGDRRRIDLLHHRQYLPFAAVSAPGDDSVRFDFDEEPRVEQAGDDEHCARGPNLAEDLAVRTADLLPVIGRSAVDAGANHVLGPRAELRERLEDDPEAPARPRVRPGWRGGA